MVITGFTIASLIFTVVLKEPSPVPVFILFALIQAGSMSLYALLPGRGRRVARMVSMFLMGTMLFVLVGVMSRTNIQLEGFFFYLFSGAMSGAIVHFLMGKTIGTIVFGRNWCSWGCWTAMILDLLPFKNDTRRHTGWVSSFRYIHFALALLIPAVLFFGLNHTIIHTDAQALKSGVGTFQELVWFLTGNAIYYAVGITLAVVLRDNRAFCKYVCPVSIFLKLGSSITLLRIKGKKQGCTDCRACTKACPMSIEIPSYIKAGQRVTSTECIMCMNCVASCPQGLLQTSVGLDVAKGVKAVNVVDSVAARPNVGESRADAAVMGESRTKQESV